MRSVLSAFVLLAVSSVAMAEKPLLLVTPNGVWSSEVTAAGPGPWIAQDIDVIVQGFGPGGGPDVPDPKPPVDDSEISKIVAISKSGLKDKSEAMAAGMGDDE